MLVPKTLEDMGNIIKHTNYANTGTQFTFQDASNSKCSTFKEVSAKLKSWMYSNDSYFQNNAETTYPDNSHTQSDNPHT